MGFRCSHCCFELIQQIAYASDPAAPTRLFNPITLSALSVTEMGCLVIISAAVRARVLFRPFDWSRISEVRNLILFRVCKRRFLIDEVM